MSGDHKFTSNLSALKPNYNTDNMSHYLQYLLNFLSVCEQISLEQPNKAIHLIEAEY